MTNAKKIRGYVFSREAEGQFVPQRMQNMVIREYVESKQCKFLLSAVEYYMENCYMMLDSLLEKIDEVDGLVFFSMTFLPKDKQKREFLFKKILDHGKELHFALESFSIQNEKGLEQLDEILAIRRLTENKEVAGSMI